ncbi:tRNA pseudouridine(38-40) synthase TruA [Sedimentibacter sp. zth1]|uniref:tRNA pseudouridine(38-40) synthase TruA n=1 Tax=Sedimentibacter sp. zth1 TaxID=2816908 RepID=UPI001A92F139|nr:tRNA pseudouridine(38-40) synthase TruA [Sedimentibacter sp. zth1]QSX06021.1 tRNA pseudouridine(38-40) synthase TruA [Sedimentibacter sp. zth1]
MNRNIKLTIMYDGNSYFGWQKQKDLPTVQQAIEKAIYNITKENVNLVGSGRTDSKVHALGQVANFITDSSIPTDRFARAINSNIDTRIRIMKAEEVDISFNSRFSSKKKTYLYQIYNKSISNPFYDKYACFVPYELDIEKMRSALKLIEGEHDFKAFMASNSDVKSTIRQIYSTKIIVENSLIKVEIMGNGFLYNMVRIIVGTLLEIGSNRKEINVFKRAFELKDRNVLGQTAKAEGLFLKKVIY